MTQQGSLIAAGGVIVFAVLWFVVKALVGNVVAHWLLLKARRRGWGRPKKDNDDEDRGHR